MALEPDDLLERAADAVRRHDAEPPDGWDEVAASVRRRVRLLVPPGEPLEVRTPDGALAQDEHGSRTYVSERVVRDALRRLLQASPTHAPDDIDLDVDDHRVRRVALDLVVAYGVDIRPLGDSVRADVVDLLDALLGPDPERGAGQVDVRVVDVTLGDPNLSGA